MKSVLPELKWTAGPPETKSYAITFIDVTLTKGTPPKEQGYHWTMYNIPPSTLGLAEGTTTAAAPAKQTGAFLGPCPNFGSAPPTGKNTDTYEFTLYALGTETLSLSGSGVSAQTHDAETKLEAMNLAKVKLTGTSNAANTQ
jgi:phosphatidylethanolamine-binding protein (PEBP) family uncharacterized protein